MLTLTLILIASWFSCIVFAATRGRIWKKLNIIDKVFDLLSFFLDLLLITLAHFGLLIVLTLFGYAYLPF